MDIIIDGNLYHSKDEFHKEMKNIFNFPDYYGNNLDALWDLLGEREELSIILINSKDLLLNLGNYGEKIFNIFMKLSVMDNNSIKFYWDREREILQINQVE